MDKEQLKELFRKHHKEETDYLEMQGVGTSKYKLEAGCVWTGFKSAFNIMEKALKEMETFLFDGEDTDNTREEKSLRNRDFIRVFKTKIQEVSADSSHN